MKLENWLSESDIEKITALNNPKVVNIIETFLTLCKPSSARVFTDTPSDLASVRDIALTNGEEFQLSLPGHTIHFDGFYDQGRDKANTRLLIDPSLKENYCSETNTFDRDAGLTEIYEIMDGCMVGKVALIRFYSLGPLDSPLSIPALQITDSAYVAHSEDILYRQGYQEFIKLNGSEDFFYFIHSAGELTDKNVTKNIEKRRMFIDPQENRVLSVNNQYAGNSLGLKKLALRLAINKANIDKDWLAEHMFISGVYSLDRTRKTYFLGAFPSACGKTSTAMVPGNTIMGDDIAYLKIIDGSIRAVNIENGIFGIIQDVNAIDDPEIFKALTSPGEIIFSNVLISDGKPYWLGMGDDVEIPKSGTNWSSSLLGEWHEGKTDPKGKVIKFAHPNARYTLRLEELDNCDEALQDPLGIEVSGIIYGGRDSDTSVPIYECLTWSHGVFVGASLESETTTATLGEAGLRAHQPMANLDFMVVPLGSYLDSHFKFCDSLPNNKTPLIFSTNYFLRDAQGRYHDAILDKKIWLLWAEGRAHGDYEVIVTPIGLIPKYEDLVTLFKETFNHDYERERYETEFSIRIQKFLEKLDRIEDIYLKEKGVPELFFEELNNQRKRLLDVQEAHGSDIISPFAFLS